MEKKDLEGITKIAVKRFKSIAEKCEIEISPLTILAGANSSGKSSIMQPLLMLKQTLEARYDPGPLLIDGPNVKFTIVEQFLSSLSNEVNGKSFTVGIGGSDDGLSYFVNSSYRKSKNQIEVMKMTVDQSIYPENFTLLPKMSKDEIKKIAEPPSLSEDADVVRRSGCFLRLASQHGYSVFNIVDILADHIYDTIHIPGLRGNPERVYKISSVGKRYPGTFENYAASVIHLWQESADERLKSVTNSLHALSLTGDVSTNKIGDVGIEVKVGRLPLHSTNDPDLVNIADVGFGVSQVLPVIVALIAAKPGQLVYLEQPELHLHPNAQVALTQVLADAAKRGVRVVAETHSSLLLLGVQILVAEGQLAPELVKLHWFSRNKEGITEVDSVDIDEAGRYGDWSVDFDKVDIKSEDRYLTALDKLRFGKE